MKKLDKFLTQHPTPELPFYNCIEFEFNGVSYKYSNLHDMVNYARSFNKTGAYIKGRPYLTAADPNYNTILESGRQLYQEKVKAEAKKLKEETRIRETVFPEFAKKLRDLLAEYNAALYASGYDSPCIDIAIESVYFLDDAYLES